MCPETPLIGMSSNVTTMDRLEIAHSYLNKSSIRAIHPALGDLSKEMKLRYGKVVCTPMFVAAQFTISKIWNQLKLDKESMIYKNYKILLCHKK